MSARTAAFETRVRDCLAYPRVQDESQQIPIMCLLDPDAFKRRLYWARALYSVAEGVNVYFSIPSRLLFISTVSYNMLCSKCLGLWVLLLRLPFFGSLSYWDTLVAFVTGNAVVIGADRCPAGGYRRRSSVLRSADHGRGGTGRLVMSEI